MIIAEQKRRENIAEYLIYMYQVEDLVRANEFDPVKIEKNIINEYDASYDVKREMLEWYKGHVDRLRSEGKEKQGHMEFLEHIAEELDQLNNKLLKEPLNDDFKEIYERARPNIDALRMRSGHSKDNDVQLALNGLYGLLLLKLGKSEINEETEKAFSTISEWIAILTAEYMKNS